MILEWFLFILLKLLVSATFILGYELSMIFIIIMIKRNEMTMKQIFLLSGLFCLMITSLFVFFATSSINLYYYRLSLLYLIITIIGLFI